MKSFRDFIYHLRYEVLDKDFNYLQVDFGDDEIAFKLYDMAEVMIVYDGDVDNIKVYGYNEDSCCTGMDFGEIKDIYGVMKAIKENSEMLDAYIKM